MKSLEQALRLAIKKELDKCRASSTPNVCERIKTKEGYRSVEDMIIRMLIHDSITPGAAISQIESDLL
jgi:hypothetical protein